MSSPTDRKYEAHVFICTNQREPGAKRASCAASGSAHLRDELKARCKRPEYKGRLRVNASGCLDRCEEGIAAVIYPEGRWFTELKDDEESLKKLERAISETLTKP